MVFLHVRRFVFFVHVAVPWDPILDPGGKSEALKGALKIQ